jgi:hypothetical protein
MAITLRTWETENSTRVRKFARLCYREDRQSFRTVVEAVIAVNSILVNLIRLRRTNDCSLRTADGRGFSVAHLTLRFSGTLLLLGCLIVYWWAHEAQEMDLERLAKENGADP